MTLNIELPDEQVAALRMKAASQGLTLEAWLSKVAAEQTPGERPLQSVSDMILDCMRDVPAEEFAKLPKDGASEHDHYIYGTPKRNS